MRNSPYYIVTGMAALALSANLIAADPTKERQLADYAVKNGRHLINGPMDGYYAQIPIPEHEKAWFTVARIITGGRELLFVGRKEHRPGSQLW